MTQGPKPRLAKHHRTRQTTRADPRPMNRSFRTALPSHPSTSKQRRLFHGIAGRLPFLFRHAVRNEALQPHGDLRGEHIERTRQFGSAHRLLQQMRSRLACGCEQCITCAELCKPNIDGATARPTAPQTESETAPPQDAAAKQPCWGARWSRSSFAARVDRAIAPP